MKKIQNHKSSFNSKLYSDIRIVDELQFKHQLSKVESQKKAWKRIMAENQLSKLDLENDKVDVWNWYNANNLMRDIYEEINIDIILNLIKKIKTFEQSYSLLYSAGAFINGKLSRGENVELKTINCFLSLVEEICINQNEFELADIDRTDSVLRLYRKVKNYPSSQNLSQIKSQ